MAHHQEIQERQEILFQFSHRELSIYMYQHFINPNKLLNWTDQVDGTPVYYNTNNTGR
jgi:hypothetical protein